jgi:RND family efflux transporter MFP subunit
MSTNDEKMNQNNPNEPSAPIPAKGVRRSKVIALLVMAIGAAAAAYAHRDSLSWLWRPEQAGAQAVARPAAAKERKILYWHDPMHPQYRSDKPGTAPDCGMDLVPVYEEGVEPVADLPEGAIRITPERQQLIGVKYGEVSREPLATTIRAVGRLSFDETRIARIHSKIAGWIEQVYVDFTGKLVEKDQPLVSVYSPELVATQEEYLLALRAQTRLGGSIFKEISAGADSLLEAARRRLELWDITPAQIAELDRTRKPAKAITIYSPVSGFVVTRNAYDRQRIMPETELYTLADLSTIWVIADVYEYEAPMIREGQSATMTLSYFRGRSFRGKVTYIYPQLDVATRTVKVRVEFPNPDFALKPDMYADVELRIDYGPQLSVPADAVLDSGAAQLVFVALEGGYFEPRKVTLGGKVGERSIVLNGLKEGERIVTSGNFLIDSESRLKSAASGMGMPGMQHGEPAGGKPPAEDHSKHQAPMGQEQPVDHSKPQKKEMEGHKHD